MQPLSKTFEKAARLQGEGRMREAIASYQAILREDPKHAGSLELLGVLHAQQGDFGIAVRLIEKARLLNPQAPEVHNNLGMVLRALGRGEDAIAAYKQAIKLRPNYVVAWNNLGIEMAGLDRDQEAIDCYRKALAIAPNDAAAQNNLASVLIGIGQHREAIELLNDALETSPLLADAKINLGHALSRAGRSQEAISHYRAVLLEQPSNDAVMSSIANQLRLVGEYEEAADHYDLACRVNPMSGVAHSGRGLLLQELGKMDEARSAFVKAVECEPTCMTHFLHLTRSGGFEPDSLLFAAMLALEADIPSLSEEERIDAHFAFGDALKRIGENDRSFAHILAGNALKRRVSTYNEKVSLGFMRRVTDVFTAELIQRRQEKALGGSTPIFIVGMPRSGSTLVEQILASHPNVFAAGEVNAFRQTLHSTGLSISGRAFPESIPASSGEEIRNFASAYVRAIQSLASTSGAKPSVTHITDKMLSNFRYIGLIRMAIPNARIIHLRRDPIDTCLSCFSIQFAKLPYTYDLGELGRHYSEYYRTMRHWEAALPSDGMLDIRYENLVANFEMTARSIVAYCGLEWSDACLEFHKTERPVRTASVAQVRRPLYSDAVGRWRPDDQILAPLLGALQESGCLHKTGSADHSGRRSEELVARPDRRGTGQ